MNLISDLSAGIAGEYLVCADLIMQGYGAFPSDQGLPFDVVADVCGKLIKIQVKSARVPRTTSQRGRQPKVFIFGCMSVRGKSGKKVYLKEHVDVFALVGLSEKGIAYVSRAKAKSTVQIRPECNRGTYQNELLEKQIAEMRQMRTAGQHYDEIGRAFKRSRGQVARLIKSGAASQNKGLYFSDLPFSEAIK